VPGGRPVTPLLPVLVDRGLAISSAAVPGERSAEKNCAWLCSDLPQWFARLCSRCCSAFAWAVTAQTQHARHQRRRAIAGSLVHIGETYKLKSLGQQRTADVPWESGCGSDSTNPGRRLTGSYLRCPHETIFPASRALLADSAAFRTEVGFGRTTFGQIGILAHQVLVPSRISFWYFQGDQSHLLLESHGYCCFCWARRPSFALCRNDKSFVSRLSSFPMTRSQQGWEIH